MDDYKHYDKENIFYDLKTRSDFWHHDQNHDTEQNQRDNGINNDPDIKVELSSR